MPAETRVHLDPGATSTASWRADVRAGLTATPKTLPPKYFYDARGSELFDEITRLPEYYPTRTERSILDAHAADDRRADAVPRRWSSSAAAPRRRPGCCCAPCATRGTLRAVRARSTSTRPCSSEASAALAAEYPGLRGRRRSSATSSATSASCPGSRPPAASRSSAPPSATSSPAERADVPGRGRAARCGRATPSCSAPTW